MTSHNAKVRKISGKPFKSGLKVGTVESLCCSLYTDKRKLAFVLTDGSLVNIELCYFV